MDKIGWLLLLMLGSCTIGIVMSAGHCVYTGVPSDCPRVIVDGRCVSGLLGC